MFGIAAALKSGVRITSVSVSFPTPLQGVLGASCNRDVGVPFPGTHWPRSQNPLLWVYNHLNELFVPAGRSSEQLYLGYTEKASILARHVTLPQLCKTGPKSMSDKIKMGRWKKHRM